MSLDHLATPIYTTTLCLLGESKGTCRCCAVAHILQEFADGVLTATIAVTLAMSTEVWPSLSTNIVLTAGTVRTVFTELLTEPSMSICKVLNVFYRNISNNCNIITYLLHGAEPFLRS